MLSKAPPAPKGKSVSATLYLPANASRIQGLGRLISKAITASIFRSVSSRKNRPGRGREKSLIEVPPFIATIANRDRNGFKLPGNIEILTWNYDLQLEVVLKRYVPIKIHEIKARFQIFPNHNSFDVQVGNLANLGSFAAVKLNGNAFWDNPSETGEDLKTTIFDKFYGTNRPSYLVTTAFFHALQQRYGKRLGLLYSSSMTDNQGLNLALTRSAIDAGHLALEGAIMIRCMRDPARFKHYTVFPCSDFTASDVGGQFAFSYIS